MCGLVCVERYRISLYLLSPPNPTQIFSEWLNSRGAEVAAVLSASVSPVVRYACGGLVAGGFGDGLSKCGKTHAESLSLPTLSLSFFCGSWFTSQAAPWFVPTTYTYIATAFALPLCRSLSFDQISSWYPQPTQLLIQRPKPKPSGCFETRRSWQARQI